MLERTARDNQGWTIKCHALKVGLSLEKDFRKLGEARRVRKTSLRRSEQ